MRISRYLTCGSSFCQVGEVGTAEVGQKFDCLLLLLFMDPRLDWEESDNELDEKLDNEPEPERESFDLPVVRSRVFFLPRSEAATRSLRRERGDGSGTPRPNFHGW